jgi:hypothetical protein
MSTFKLNQNKEKNNKIEEEKMRKKSKNKLDNLNIKKITS